MKNAGDEQRNSADDQSGKMNADEEWQRGDKRTPREEKKNSSGRLKYLWCHLCWCMMPSPCNNMNTDCVGCFQSHHSTLTIYSTCGSVSFCVSAEGYILQKKTHNLQEK